MQPAISVAPWAPILWNARELAEYIGTWAGSEVCAEVIEEYYFGCGARLELVPIDQIKPGPDEANIPSKKKEARYAKMPLETMPPLVIENGVLDDGHHRLRIAKAKGTAALWCYVVVEEAELKPARKQRAGPSG